MLSEQQRNIVDAIERGDWDAAIQHVLLDIVVDDSWPNAAQILKVQSERRFALESRERYRAKLQREDERKQALQRKRAKTTETRLPTAAQSALERAKARAAEKRK